MSVESVSPEQDASRSALDIVVTVLTFATLLATLVLTPSLLDQMGIPYDQPTGNPLTKIHPGTYLAVLALVANALRRGNPIHYVIEIGQRFPGVLFFFVIWLFVLLWAPVIQRLPATGIIDTFLPTIAIFLLIADLDEAEHALMTRLMHVFMAVNALLCIIEVGSGWRLTPVVANGILIEWDWRGTALLGHPLANAVTTGAYILMLFFGADRSIPSWLRFSMLMLQGAALVCFGGRTASVVALAIILPVLLWRCVGLLRGDRFDPRIAAAVVMIAPLVFGGFATAWDLGLFDRFVERFVDDQGSAQTRVAMLNILRSFNLHDLLLSPDQGELIQKMWLEDTTIAIESFVIGFFLQYGILISLVFFVALLVFSYEIWRIGGRFGWLYFLYFYLVAAGASSLSSKTQIFVFFVALFATVEARPAVNDLPPSAE